MQIKSTDKIEIKHIVRHAPLRDGINEAWAVWINDVPYFVAPSDEECIKSMLDLGYSADEVRAELKKIRSLEK